MPGEILSVVYRLSVKKKKKKKTLVYTSPFLMGHHYKVFNKSKDDAEEKKKKKMENPAALGSTLRDKNFSFLSFLFLYFLK